jgi:hypothetical protein
MGKVPQARQEIKTSYSPSGRQPRATEDPGSTETQTPAWQFHRCDESHHLWGWGKLSPSDRLEIISTHLIHFEKMTWAAIKQQCGGRKRGTNHHSLSIENFTRTAQARLTELGLDEYDELFSLRLGNMVRLYGIREGRVLRFVWHDPHHGSANASYPTSK